MTAHHPFGPSSADRIIACPGSIPLSAAVREAYGEPPESAAAALGTLAHDLAAQSLEGNLPDIPDELLDAIEYYTEYVADLMCNSHWYGIEKRVEIPDVCFGTADFYCWDGKTLTVVDYKNGGGVIVPAENNSQLMLYAAGVYHSEAHRLPDDAVPVRLIIVQPNASKKVKTWDTTTQACLRRAESLKNAIEIGTGEKRHASQLNPGAHCTFCPAASRCLTRLQAWRNKKPWDLLSNDDLEEYYADYMEQIKSMHRNIEFELYRQARQGKCKRLKLVETQGRARWAPGAEDELMHQYGDAAFKRVPKAISAVVKQFGEEVLHLTEKPAGDLKLVQRSDPRPEFATPEAEFEPVEETP